MEIVRRGRLHSVVATAFMVILSTLVASQQPHNPGAIFVSESSNTFHDRQQELDALFAKLRDKSDDPDTFKTEQKIWSLWMQSDSTDEDKILTEATNAMNTLDFRLAEELLNRLIALNKNYAEAWNKRATLYYLMGRYNESLIDIVKTLDLEPRHFGALSGRGMILRLQGKIPEALAAYRDAYAINPHMPGVAAAIKELETVMPDL
jgi:tetratricopeptide (TPR) repeat protein